MPAEFRGDPAKADYLKSKAVIELLPRITERILGRRDPDPQPDRQAFQLMLRNRATSGRPAVSGASWRREFKLARFRENNSKSFVRSWRR